MSKLISSLEEQYAHLNAAQLRRILVEHLTKQKLGLYWEHDSIERDLKLNGDVVLPVLDEEASLPSADGTYRNLVIEGDNFDSLRLLRATHAGKIRVIYIDPPYNTGNKDWVYNDRFVGKNDRWRHSQWLEFLYQRLRLARDLLTPDGVIMVSINDENRAKLELLMDDVFGGMRVGSLAWRTRDTTSAKGRNFSDVHEHILVYAAEGFAFNGREKTQKKYKNPDKDPRGPWNGDPLTLAFDRFERENLFYPLHNPETDRWYPCDENRVWAYATEDRVEEGQELQAETMEEFIRRKQILFPTEEKVVIWNSLEEIYAAIEAGDVPVTPKRKRPLITKTTPDLEFWVGKQVGFGRPLFKKFWKDLRSHVNPLSSWIFRVNEVYDDEDFAAMTSPNAGEGTEVIQAIFGRKVFQYPKPPALIRELLRQASKPGDIVLDFFAGSATTGQCVLELNEEDDGERRFILCSNTEATTADASKNICRDVTAERLRRVVAGFAGFEPVAGDFAYLKLVKYDPADVALDATPENAFLTLCMRHSDRLTVTDDGAAPRI
ncbi:site-specific DNA-methyltransferase [Burkholderia multivorans]|uniref:site-specific DNA-methyltransferase n=1 Tax=Burkholderia multivorans TaxID=87883 RepID=UPI0021DA2CA6|nr:site-specific DNA-methyltransferase [Burkholderia multivorans]UXZ60793.1 site-specific DNA-methyltransferase [Burkholderia multivorans]